MKGRGGDGWKEKKKAMGGGEQIDRQERVDEEGKITFFVYNYKFRRKPQFLNEK